MGNHTSMTECVFTKKYAEYEIVQKDRWCQIRKSAEDEQVIFDSKLMDTAAAAYSYLAY